MKVICVGDCGIDHYLPGDELHVGGITANVARHIRDQLPEEDTVIVVSCLGNDRGADLVRAAFQNTGIDCLWQTDEGATPVQHIEIQPDGERRFVGYEAGVLAGFRFSDRQREAIRTSDVLLAPVYAQIVDLYDRLMTEPAGGLVCIDFADFLDHPDFDLLERHLAGIDIAFFGLSADLSTAIDRLASLARRHDKLFVVTLGAAGSLAFRGAETHRCQAEPVAEVIDTTGAGDAYAAAFMARYCADADIPAAMHNASRLAAEVVARAGSYPAGTGSE